MSWTTLQRGPHGARDRAARTGRKTRARVSVRAGRNAAGEQMDVFLILVWFLAGR